MMMSQCCDANYVKAVTEEMSPRNADGTCGEEYL